MIQKGHTEKKLWKSVLATFMAVCVLFSLSVPLFADSDDDIEVVDPIGNIEGHSAVLYGNTDGLPTSEANAITATSDGFIWIGSYGGLIRYDGNTFERFSSTTGIASVVSLYGDSKNMLWIGTNDHGAAAIDRYGNITMFGKDIGLPSASVRGFTEDSEGNIYMATTMGVAVVDLEMNLTVVDDPMIRNEYIRHIETGPDGIVYGLTQDGDVFALSGGRVTGFYTSQALGLEDAVIRAMHVDEDNPGYLYLGTDRTKIYYGSFDTGFPGDKAIVVHLNTINSITSVGEDLWICANNGIAVYRDGEVLPLENVPMTSNVEGCMCDYQGNLWFVSSRQGVMKIVPDQFTDLFEKYNIEREVVNSTCFYDEMLFMGTDSGLRVGNTAGEAERITIDNAVTASGNHLGYKELLTMFNGVRIRSIIKDSQDRLWFSTFDKLGLVRYDHGEVLTFSTDDGMPSNRIRAVNEMSDGSFAVACTGGVVVIKGDSIEKVYDASSGVSNTEVLTVSEGENGDILAGTDGGGIFIIGSSGVTNIDTDNGLYSDIVMRIKKDNKRNVYWIVTSNSLAYMTSDYEPHTIENFPYSNNFDIYENSLGELWILSSNGIYVTTADDLIANGNINPVFYGIDDGLPIIATSNSYSYVTDEGILYIAGTTGVAKVNIETTFETVSNIRMSVPYLDADGVKIYPDENGVFNIPTDAKKVTIYPYIFTYRLMNPKVTYYLEGFDREQMVIKRSDLTSIDYTNLRGGKYTFRMIISDSMGHENNEFAISIVKKRAVYEMLWFYLLIFVVVVCGTTMAVLYYVNKKTEKYLKKQEEDRILIREIVEAFAKTIDMKDKYTRGHSIRVAHYTSMLAQELGYNEETVEKYRNIALLHDIGKIGVRGEVLNKNGRLEDDEFAEIKSHTTLGYNVLKDISIMPELSVGAESHHERPDGKGYPDGLKGDEIPRVAQIIGVADAFDAMYSDRPYRKRMNFEKAVSIIRDASGTQFHEDVVDAFLRIVERGGFRADNDKGGGSTEDIDNIHKRFEKEHDAEEAAKEHKHDSEAEKPSDKPEQNNEEGNKES